MPGDPKPPIDTKLSETDVKRVLERAVQIDGTQTVVSVSDLTHAAHEAGISEAAVMQAVQELLEDRKLAATPDPVGTTSGEARIGAAFWVRAAGFASLVVIALMVISFVIRLLFP